MLDDWVPPHVGLDAPLQVFAQAAETQSQGHIRPMHQYIALRLVLEGGFLPDEVTPHPPLASTRKSGRYVVEFAPELETATEKTVLGGLKTKDIDVVVTKPDLGPVLAVSVKGTGGAFRNLTNRMEEAIGDCTNLHIMYPGLVYGFLSMIRANRSSDAGFAKNDVCLVERDGAEVAVVDAVQRYHDILSSLSGRRFVRDEQSRYEAVGMLLVESAEGNAGAVFPAFPPATSPLHFHSFFPTLYVAYDLRYPYMATRMASAQRVAWDGHSPAIRRLCDVLGSQAAATLGYEWRVG
jgi:hypothetical protein